MSYEFKEEILLDIGTEPNCNYESESNRYYDKLEELDEVYAKAEAFDEIVDCLEKQVAYGLKDSEVLSEIDYLIRETFYNSKNNIYRRTEECSE